MCQIFFISLNLLIQPEESGWEAMVKDSPQSYGSTNLILERETNSSLESMRFEMKYNTGSLSILLDSSQLSTFRINLKNFV